MKITCILAAALLCIVASAARSEQPIVAPTTKIAVTIATGNTFQTIKNALGPNESLHSLTIQNNNASDSCWVVIGGALGSATKGLAILLLAGGAYTRYYPYVPSDAIHVTCASSSDTLYVDYQ